MTRRSLYCSSLLLFIGQISHTFSLFVHSTVHRSFLPRHLVVSKMSSIRHNSMKSHNHGTNKSQSSRSSPVGVLVLHSLQEDDEESDIITMPSDVITSSCPALFSLQDILTDKTSNGDNVSVVSTEVSLSSIADFDEGASTSSSTFLEKVELNNQIPTPSGQSTAKSLAAMLVSMLLRCVPLCVHHCS